MLDHSVGLILKVLNSALPSGRLYSLTVRLVKIKLQISLRAWAS